MMSTIIRTKEFMFLDTTLNGCSETMLRGLRIRIRLYDVAMVPQLASDRNRIEVRREFVLTPHYDRHIRVQKNRQFLDFFF